MVGHSNASSAGEGIQVINMIYCPESSHLRLTGVPRELRRPREVGGVDMLSQTRETLRASLQASAYSENELDHCAS